MYPYKFPNTNVYVCACRLCNSAAAPPPTTTSSPSLDQFFHDTSPYLLSPQVSPCRRPRISPLIK